MASLRYDPSSKALYVRIRARKVTETQPLNDNVFMGLEEQAGERLIDPARIGMEPLCKPKRHHLARQ